MFLEKLFRYWWKVLKEAFGNTFRLPKLKEFAFDGLLYFLGRAFISAIASLGIFSSDLSTRISTLIGEELTLLLYFTFIYILVTLLASIIYIPAKIYDEMGGFDKMDLKLAIISHPPRLSERFICLEVLNNSNTDITDCKAILTKVVKHSDNSYQLQRPEKLAWSHAHPPIDENKTIPIGGEFAIDIARTQKDFDLIGFITPHRLVDSTGPGKYAIEIAFKYIAYGKRREKKYKGIILYKGGFEIECYDS
jgi:hypothetical protein